jgi:hypothetical protein
MLFSAKHSQQALPRPRFFDGGDAGTTDKIADAYGVQFMDAS